MTREFDHLRYIAPFHDVFHRVQKGGIISHHFDFEAFGLNTTFSQIAKYGDCIGDFAGNMIGTSRINVRRLDFLYPTLGASLVVPGLLDVMDAPDSVPHYHAMGMIAQRFEDAPFMIKGLKLPEKFIEGETFSKKGPHYAKKNLGEFVLLYPTRDEQGHIIDAVRYHPEREKFSYRVTSDPTSRLYENIDNLFYCDADDPDTKWKWVDPTSYISGYRVRSYDMAVLRSNFVRAGQSPRNIFFLTSRATLSEKQRPKNRLVDAYFVNLSAAKFGNQGDERLILGRKPDSETGEIVESAKLELVYEANTRDADPLRETGPGLLMPDGRQYDVAQAHEYPDYDSMASYGLEAFHRRVNPDIIRLHEQQADKDYLLKYLPALAATDNHRPVYFLPKSNYPDDTSVAPYFFLGFDDIYGQQNRGLFIKIHEGLSTRRVLGKALHELTPDEWRHYIEKSRHTPDELIIIPTINRWRGAIPEDIAYASPAAHRLDLEMIDSDLNYLFEHPSIRASIGQALEDMNWERVQKPEPANPYMEEQAIRNGFGDIDYLEAYQRQTRRRHTPHAGGISSASEFLTLKAKDIFDYNNAIDEALHLIMLQPHQVDYSDDPAALDKYNILMKRVIRRLRKKKSPYAAIFDGYLDKKGFPVFPTTQTARDFREKKLIECLGHYKTLSERKKDTFGRGYFDFNMTDSQHIIFANLSRDFRVIDPRGRQYRIEDLEVVQPQLLIKGVESGRWRIQFDRLSSDFSIQAILFRFASLNRLGNLPQEWQDRYRIIKDNYIAGPLSEPAQTMRIPAAPQLEWEAQQFSVNAPLKSQNIEGNKPSFMIGRAQALAKTPESLRIFNRWNAGFQAWKSQALPDTPEVRRAKNYNEAGAPIDFHEHEVEQEKSIILRVSDMALRHAVYDFRLGPKAVLVPSVPVQVKLAIVRNRGQHVILEGRESGRLYACGTLSVKALPPEEQFSHLYEQQRRAKLALSDLSDQLFGNLLIFEGLYPLSFTRSIHQDYPAISLPSIFFDGLVSPFLSGVPRVITAQIYASDAMTQNFSPGQPLLLREAEGSPQDAFSGKMGPTTGHHYMSVIRDVKRLTLQELESKIMLGQFDDFAAQHLGYSGAVDLASQIRDQANTLRMKNSDQLSLMIVSFAPVEKSSWAYDRLEEVPKAIFVSNDVNRFNTPTRHVA